jgi:hypothetical protein
LKNLVVATNTTAAGMALIVGAGGGLLFGIYALKINSGDGPAMQRKQIGFRVLVALMILTALAGVVLLALS